MVIMASSWKYHRIIMHKRLNPYLLLSGLAFPRGKLYEEESAQKALPPAS